ncbi:GT2 family glycosyltransferase [Lutibacter sp. Hel_I_33_5]|uniref:glycosyltransferase family 2 protein n=1 Tax=Lutibacter sp. Hel_I_33_5 TaxID=1566289 RepID=UPI0011A5C29C|nr:glycosyltransferase [Lutibacter sp. Hel_I_33_5]TVZ54867.1 GT2 family glycosyltransferase [Lutibacter sp. Hel_I_33_5]
MKFSLIICTYMRPQSILTLLKSVNEQMLYPDEIIIVDGSTDDKSKEIIEKNNFKKLLYYKVAEENRGLTKQRNFGINKVSKDIEVVCFLDDDIVLVKSYFKNLLTAYAFYSDAGGIGGYIINEVKWRPLKVNEKPKFKDYVIDGWVRNLGGRNVIRKILGLLSNEPPCIMPKFSNGFSVSYLPPNGKIYKAEYFMGGVSSFKKKVLDSIKFSEYFTGYGLYEDLEYCLRVSKKYKLYVNTAATLFHYHEESGRPNKYNYGKMVIRNGWYVWRTSVSYPSLITRFKWNTIMLILMISRFTNIFTTTNKKEAFAEFIGRKVGLLTLLFNKPKIQE